MGAVSSILILNFIAMWNDFLFTVVMMRTNSAKTLPVGLLTFKGRYLINWGPMMVGLDVEIIPNIIFFFVFHRNLMKGVVVGAMKG
jgi:raffinose/stachyose/melibiose transport system permease protein